MISGQKSCSPRDLQGWGVESGLRNLGEPSGEQTPGSERGQKQLQTHPCSGAQGPTWLRLWLSPSLRLLTWCEARPREEMWVHVSFLLSE